MMSRHTTLGPAKEYGGAPTSLYGQNGRQRCETES